MDSVLDYTIPVLHPLAVHFPLVLLLLLAAVTFGWALLDRPFWLQSSLLVSFLGGAASIAAFVTGEAMEEQSEGVPMVELLLPQHEWYAKLTMISSVILFLLIAAAFMGRFRSPRRPGSPPWIRWPVFGAALIGAALVAWTAHIGGTMVWGVIR